MWLTPRVAMTAAQDARSLTSVAADAIENQVDSARRAYRSAVRDVNDVRDEAASPYQENTVQGGRRGVWRRHLPLVSLQELQHYARSAVVAKSDDADGVSRHAGGSARRLAPALLLAAVLVDPFAFFQPTVRVEPAERDALSKGTAFVRAVPAPPRHVAIVAAVPVHIDGARLVAWINDIAALKKSPMVRQVGRFSACRRSTICATSRSTMSMRGRWRRVDP